MLDMTPNQTDVMPALVQFSAMVFGAAARDHALEVLATALGVSTVAIGRIESGTGRGQILAQNVHGLTVRAGWENDDDASDGVIIELAQGATRDVLVIRSPLKPLSPSQYDRLSNMTPFVVAFWAARKAGFDHALRTSRIEATENMLHPDNPYRLTRSELRVCHLIAQGQRPDAMAASLGTSMTTIRTHLRHIYTKTGLDGMFSVLHHLQQFSYIETSAP